MAGPLYVAGLLYVAGPLSMTGIRFSALGAARVAKVASLFQATEIH